MTRKQAAADTIALIERGVYNTSSGAEVRFADDHAASLAGTHLYRPCDFPLALPEPGLGPVEIVVISEATQLAARRAAAEFDVALLNFASARNPGGGFLNGAKAQEEDLCSCSTLYPTLLRAPEYYRANRGQASLLYTDHIIYSPKVTFFRTAGSGDLLEEPFVAGVITAPAPNSGPLLRLDPRAKPAIRETFARRWRYVLEVAALRGHDAVVLGAWGCGCFGGDPVIASATLAEVLPDFKGRFRRVELAIPAHGRRERSNYAAFCARFG